MARRSYTPEQAEAARQERLQEFSDKIERAVGALVTDADWIGAVAFAAKFRARSFSNTLAIYVQHHDAYQRGLVPNPEPTYVAGFKQWQQLRRQVAKGQPGYMIMAPVTALFANADPAHGEWRRLGRNERPRTGEYVSKRLVGVKPAYVWDASQTTGDGEIPLRAVPKLLEGQAPAGLWNGLADRIVIDHGFTLSESVPAAEIGGANGMTDFTMRHVSIREDMDEAARVKTLAHELGHIVLHYADGGRIEHRGIGEVEAESFAAMVCACYGMDSTGYTVPYVAGWAETVKDRTPQDVLRATGERVRTAVLGELEHLPPTLVDDGNPPGLVVAPSRDLPVVTATESRTFEREAVGL